MATGQRKGAPVDWVNLEVPLVSRTAKLVDTCLTFIIDGAHKIQGLMAALAIIKQLDVFEDGGSRFIPGAKREVMDQFVS
jgi:hypothetical protein